MKTLVFFEETGRHGDPKLWRFVNAGAFMLQRTLSVFAASIATAMLAMLSGCLQPATDAGSSSAPVTDPATIPSTTGTSSSTANVVKIILKAKTDGSFDASTTTGMSMAKRFYDLSGTQINTASIPEWFGEAGAYLTTTRTGGGTPAYTGGDTPCAYFDSYDDNNPGNEGYYTVDGYYTPDPTNVADVDRCAGASSTELAKVGFYFTVNRANMAATDKLNIIVTAKPLDSPNYAPTPASCITGGWFDPASCVTQLFTVSMRTGVSVPTKPFYILFPSAKSVDLLSESIYLPINTSSSLNTISIDRVKGGAVFQSITIIRIN